MQFYKIEAKYSHTPEEEFCNARRNYAFSERMQSLAEAFNATLPDDIFIFFSDFNENGLTAGIITEQGEINQNLLKKFLALTEQSFKEYRTEEIVFRQLRSMLRNANRCSLISDDDEVLEQFGLDMLTGRSARGLDISDNLLEDTDSKEELIAEAKRYSVANSFLPELERIFAGAKSANAPKGHPVHYLLSTDDTDMRRDLCRTLLKALHANGRISGRRYNFANIYPQRGVSADALNALYRCCSGSALLLRLQCDRESDEEDDQADGIEQTVIAACEAARRYRNQVLTVFCVPREATRIKRLMQEHLGNMTLVEFQEEYLSGDAAKSFLYEMTKGCGLRADKKLYDGILPGESYLAPELRERFRYWYDEKLKQTVYPQYKDIRSAAKKAAKQEVKGSAYDELQAMIGLREAKTVMQRALDYYKMQHLYKERGLRQSRPAMHMVFTGNPGTAKTTAARLFARIMKDNGLLSKGHLVEVGRGDLVGRYVGWTAKTVQEKFRAALGGVLFIDEAYSLVDDRNGSYGDEAINTIVQEMENHREELVVIFAGYPDKMEEFLQKNPGLRSRIAFHVPFADYDTDELCRIAVQMSDKAGTHLADDAVAQLRTVFDYTRSRTDFGNGRYVRNVLEQARMKQASRLLTLGFDDLSTEALTTICAEDIELPAQMKNNAARRIGFAG